MRRMSQVQGNPLVDRVEIPLLGYGDDSNGCFLVHQSTLRAGQPYMRVIATRDGEGWDHVSVSPSVPGRCPTWEEMERVRHVFFYPEETVYQIHPPVSDHINCHPWCLHLWRQTSGDMPRPPRELVGGGV